MSDDGEHKTWRSMADITASYKCFKSMLRPFVRKPHCFYEARCLRWVLTAAHCCRGTHQFNRGPGTPDTRYNNTNFYKMHSDSFSNRSEKYTKYSCYQFVGFVPLFRNLFPSHLNLLIYHFPMPRRVLMFNEAASKIKSFFRPLRPQQHP